MSGIEVFNMKNISGTSEKTIEEQVVELLLQKGYTITCAESCTGGLLCGCLVNVSGASEVLRSSVITYAEQAKVRFLGVKQETLEQFGVVSEQVAEEMAQGALRLAEADVALSVTGIAGPGGGTDEKPVGLVYIGCNVKGHTTVKRYLFSGNRLQIRESSVRAALELAKECILKQV